MSAKFLVTVICFSFCLSAVTAKKKGGLIHVTEENWKDLLKGEWMVEFYAPWCPACKDLSKAWQAFADWSVDLEIKVADVDVTKNAGLSGRFLVTALPTIYHVKDGVFRHYNGPRDKEDFISFIEEKKWTIVDPIAGWKHPDTIQMTVVAMFFRLSMSVRDLHNWFVEEKGLPPWASYCIFALATLALGCFLGFLIVMVIDFVFPTPSGPPTDEKKKEKKGKEKEKKEKEKENADLSQQESADENSADENDANVKQRKGASSPKKGANSNASPEKKKNK